MQYRIKGKFVSKADYEAWKASATPYSPNLPEMIANALQHESKAVSDMVEAINNALKERAIFERSKSRNGSHIILRQVANRFADNRRVAAFFLVVNADPHMMFNRVRKDGTRSNLKGFLKVRNLIDYITDGKPLERVTYALFAATIIAANKGISWIAAPEQELILSSEEVNSLPIQVKDAIREYQHKHMTLEGDSRPQSSQFRTTFSNLGCYVYTRDDFDDVAYTNGISVNMDSVIVQYLNTTWQLDRFK